MEKVIQKRGVKYKNAGEGDFDSVRHQLDVFYPSNNSELRNVLIFIHGGTWINGSKDIYVPLGTNLAEKGIVAVNINYRLGDVVNVTKMAMDCAEAVKWVYTNIHEYGGNNQNITLCGHSAGGHLASLIALNPFYFKEIDLANPVQNVVLIDAFGLNIGSFIRTHGSYYLHQVEKVFTSNPKTWEDSSPVNHTKDNKIPFLILVGSQTYPFLKMDNQLFLNKLKTAKQDVLYKEIPGKSHIEMITQFENKQNPLYDDLLGWVARTKRSVVQD